MRKIQGIRRVVWLLSGSCLAAASMPLGASLETECRQEAEEYAIPPEQTEDYISGCILSRGGAYAIEPAVEEYIPPPDDVEAVGSEEVSGDEPQ